MANDNMPTTISNLNTLLGEQLSGEYGSDGWYATQNAQTKDVTIAQRGENNG